MWEKHLKKPKDVVDRETFLQDRFKLLRDAANAAAAVDAATAAAWARDADAAAAWARGAVALPASQRGTQPTRTPIW